MQKNCQCSSQGQGQGLDLRAALKPRPGLDDYITDTHISVPPPVPTPANKVTNTPTKKHTGYCWQGNINMLRTCTTLF